MKKSVLISLIVVLSLVAYIIFTVMFTWVFQFAAGENAPNTPPAAPTFTETAPATAVVIVINETATPLPVPLSTDTATPVPLPTSTPTATPVPRPTHTPTPTIPQIMSAIAVNIRSGPGTNYPVLGVLPPNQPLQVVGRNDAGTWWQVPLPGGSRGWVAALVVEPLGPVSVPVAQAPPPPPPTATPVPPPPTPAPKPQFQYEPTGWYADTNYGLTRFLGTITDGNGNPVDGVSIEAQCGSFRIISNPSGPVGRPPFYDSSGDPPGFYDLTLDTRPIPCKWLLTVVQSQDGKTVSARMSDAIEVETTVDTSIVTANWRKNW